MAMTEEIDKIVDVFFVKLLEMTLNKPKNWGDERAKLFIADLKDAFLESLPKSNDLERIKHICERTRKLVRARAKTHAWPTEKEVLDALGIALDEEKSSRRDSREADWPHSNSRFMVDAARRWIEIFREWPPYHSSKSDPQIADELISSGDYVLEELIAFGYRPPA